jgi:hypothetical protein
MQHARIVRYQGDRAAATAPAAWQCVRGALYFPLNRGDSSKEAVSLAVRQPRRVAARLFAGARVPGGSQGSWVKGRLPPLATLAKTSQTCVGPQDAMRI